MHMHVYVHTYKLVWTLYMNVQTRTHMYTLRARTHAHIHLHTSTCAYTPQTPTHSLVCISKTHGAHMHNNMHAHGALANILELSMCSWTLCCLC